MIMISHCLKELHVAKWYHEPQDWIEELAKRNDEFHGLHHFIVEVNDVAIGLCQYYRCLDVVEDWYGDIELKGSKVMII